MSKKIVQKSPQVTITRPVAFEFINGFYKWLDNDLADSFDKEALLDAWELYANQQIAEAPVPEHKAMTLKKVGAFFDAHFEERKRMRAVKTLAHNSEVPFLLENLPTKPERGFSQSFILTDFRQYLLELKAEDKLKEYFPSIFGRYIRYRSSIDSSSIILEVDAQLQVSVAHPEDFEFEMINFIQLVCKTRYQGASLGPKPELTFIKTYLTPIFDELKANDVKPFAFHDTLTYSWNRLDWSLNTHWDYSVAQVTARSRSEKSNFGLADAMRLLSIHAPHWHEIMTRMKNVEAFLAWFGALLTPGVKLPRFVYVHGEGGDGKGAMIEALQKTFGEKFHYSDNIPQSKDAVRFWYYQLEHRRLLIFPDHPDEPIFTADVKIITGDSTLSVEKKQKDRRQILNNIMLFVASNYPPKTSRDRYALRRIIYCPLSGRSDDAPVEKDYAEKKLMPEIKDFLSICKLMYESMPESGEIYVDEALTLEEFKESNKFDLAMIEAKFLLHQGVTQEVYEKTKRGYKHTLPHMSIAGFAEYCSELKKNPDKMIKLIRDAYKIGDSQLIKHEGRAYKAYLGIQAKNYIDSPILSKTEEKSILHKNPEYSLAPSAWDDGSEE